MHIGSRCMDASLLGLVHFLKLNAFQEILQGKNTFTLHYLLQCLTVYGIIVRSISLLHKVCWYELNHSVLKLDIWQNYLQHRGLKFGKTSLKISKKLIYHLQINFFVFKNYFFILSLLLKDQKEKNVNKAPFWRMYSCAFVLLSTQSWRHSVRAWLKYLHKSDNILSKVKQHWQPPNYLYTEV